MDDSILDSIKKLLGITEDYPHFDTDIIIHINTVLVILNQLGVGPEEGFTIESSAEEWSEFLQNPILLSDVKSYVWLRVKLLFDPPASGTAIDAMERTCRELEWRITITVEKIQSLEEETE